MATTEAIDVVMPQMGVSVSEGTVTRWLKQEGEQVEADEALLEISTDKVDTEVPSPASGTLVQILVQEGETVDVGTKLGQIGGAPRAAPRPAAEPAGNGKFVSPVVARIASEHGIDPNQIPGTGRGGRVTKQDILAFVESGPAPAAPQAPAAPPRGAPHRPPPPGAARRSPADGRAGRARLRHAARHRRAHAPVARHR